MNKLLYVSLLSFLLIFSCTKEEDSSIVLGTYKSSDYSFADRMMKRLKGAKGTEDGSLVKLKDDHSFTYETCAISSYGKWSVKEDKLRLKETTIRWLNDSLNALGDSIKQPGLRDMIFQLSEGKFERFYTTPASEEYEEVTLYVRFEHL